MFRKIGVDRPFTTVVSDDRYRQTFHHSIVSDVGIGTYTFRHFIGSVLESNGARRQPVSVQSTLVRHSSSTPLQPSGESPNTALSVLAVPSEAHGGWSQQQGGDYYLCVFDAKLKPAVF